MFRLKQKATYLLLTMLLLVSGAVSVANAQTTALQGLQAITAVSPCTDPPSCRNSPANQTVSQWRFGYTNSTQPFTLYDRIERPAGGNAGTDGARLYTSASSSDSPSAFYNVQSALGLVSPGSTNTTAAPGPYLLTTSGGSVPVNGNNAPTGSAIQYTALGGLTNFQGFFQLDSGAGGGTVGYSVNGGAVTSLGNVLASGAASFFNFNLNLAAGDTVRFIINSTNFNNFNDIVRFNVTAVPEPATLLLLAMSGLGVAAAARRRRRGVEADELGADEAQAA